MLIAYDRKVLESARKVAASPTALQKDLLRFLYDDDVLNWDGTHTGPSVSYLAPEAKEEIKNLLLELPRRRRKTK